MESLDSVESRTPSVASDCTLINHFISLKKSGNGVEVKAYHDYNIHIYMC